MTTKSGLLGRVFCRICEITYQNTGSSRDRHLESRRHAEACARNGLPPKSSDPARCVCGICGGSARIPSSHVNTDRHRAAARAAGVDPGFCPLG